MGRDGIVEGADESLKLVSINVVYFNLLSKIRVLQIAKLFSLLSSAPCLTCRA